MTIISSAAIALALTTTYIGVLAGVALIHHHLKYGRH